MTDLQSRATNVQLLERIKDPADTDAWAEFYEFYWDLALGWTRGFGCAPGLAKDIFQETMMTLIKNLPRFSYDPGKGHFRSYLKSIVRSKLIDAYRRERKYAPVALQDSFPDDLQAPPAEFSHPEPSSDEAEELEMDLVWVRSVLRQAMRQASRRVDPTTIKSFKLHMIEGLEVEAAAARLNVNSKSVYDHKRRFLLVLEEEIGKLVHQFGGEESRTMATLKKNSSFESALKEFLADSRELGETGVFEYPPLGLLGQLRIISGALKRVPPPDRPGAYLCHFAKNPDSHVVVEPLKGLGTKTRMMKKTPEGGIVIEEEEKRVLRLEAHQWIRLEGLTTIGRGETSRIILPDSFASGLHATITPSEDGWTLRDEQSTNGTFLNGRRVDSALLKDGDVIQVTAAFQFVFYTKDA